MTCCPTCGIAVVGAGDPSPAEERMLNLVLDFHEQHGRFPTYRELKSALAYRSVHGVAARLQCLAKKGFVTLSGVRGKRGIQAARDRR